MREFLDLERFPIDQTEAAAPLAMACREALNREGMFNLEGLVRPGALETVLEEIEPAFASGAFVHARRHNIYFRDDLTDLPQNHPALTEFETVNHTVCADQIPGSLLNRIYHWAPLKGFLATVMGVPALYDMDDPMACMNVMRYHQGEALNWHFDRSEFTTTLLLQAPLDGGEFQYMGDLRSDTDPNYEAVGRFVKGDHSAAKTLHLEPGTLNVFRGRNTAHRVTPVEGDRSRVIAVFSYYERPGVVFSEAERLGFYGRTR